jgi:hypothetical protein
VDVEFNSGRMSLSLAELSNPSFKISVHSPFHSDWLYGMSLYHMLGRVLIGVDNRWEAEGGMTGMVRGKE